MHRANEFTGYTEEKQTQMTQALQSLKQFIHNVPTANIIYFYAEQFMKTNEFLMTQIIVKSSRL